MVLVGILIILKTGPCLGKRDIIPMSNKCQNPMYKRLPLIEKERPGCSFCPFGDHKELSARLTSQRQCRRRWTEKKEATRSLRSGCADAVGRRRRSGAEEKKRRHSYFAAAVPTQGGREKKEMTLTLRSGCAGAGEGEKKELVLTLRSGCACAGGAGEKKRADTRTWQRLRQRRGGARKVMALNLRSCYAGAGGPRKKEMTVLLRSGCTGVRGPIKKT